MENLSEILLDWQERLDKAEDNLIEGKNLIVIDDLRALRSDISKLSDKNMKFCGC